MKAEDIASFDVTPSWERDERDFGVIEIGVTSCQCGLCRLAAEGHL